MDRIRIEFTPSTSKTETRTRGRPIDGAPARPGAEGKLDAIRGRNYHTLERESLPAD
jgi:hypothetical protein